MATPNFRRGTEEAEQAAARASFMRVGYLGLKDGEHAVLRLLTDHDSLLTVATHNNPPTRPAPKGYTGKWPKSMPCTCRKDKAFAGMYEDCFNCLQFEQTGDKRTFAPSQRSNALAVVRKPIMESGRQVGFEDDTVEVKIGEETKIFPKIIALSQAWGNFWAAFNALQQTRGTWLDSDLHIERKGKDKDATYSVAAYPTVGVNGKRVADGSDEVFDPRKMEHAAKYIEAVGLDPKKYTDPKDAFDEALATVVAEKASDEFYARFFDTRVAQPERTNVTEGGEVHDKPAEDEPSDDELAALAARVSPHAEGELQTMAFSQ